jgi:O-antigen/teichoic acid export membrane protein
MGVRDREQRQAGWLSRISRGLAQDLRNGTLAYWATFFILILIEFYIGGRLSVVLAKENYSLYVGVLNTLPFYNVLINIGISYSIIYIVSYSRALRYSLLQQALKLQVAWYLVVVAVHAAAYFLLNNVYFQMLLITSVISFTYVHKQNFTSWFLATRSFGKAAASNVLQKLALLVVFSLICHGAISQLFNRRFGLLYPAIELGAVLLYFITFSKTSYLSFAAPAIRYRKRLLKYGKYAMLNNGLNVLYYTVIAFIIRSSALDIHIQILLGLCIIFFRYTAVAIAPLFSTMNPQLTRIKNEDEQVRKMYKKYLVITVILGFITLLACRFLFRYFIGCFYDPAYYDLPDFFNFFAYLIPLLFLNSLNGSVLAALGKIKYTTRVEVICTLLLLAFFVYNLFAPVADYRLVFYVILAHLLLRFLMLNYGAYKHIRA